MARPYFAKSIYRDLFDPCHSRPRRCLPDQESCALHSGTNHVADRLSELRDLSPRQAKFRPFDGQQTSWISPLAVTVLAPDKIDVLKNTLGAKFSCS